jgi:hypothetical protein
VTPDLIEHRRGAPTSTASPQHHAFDLDGTLAHYDGWAGNTVGEPIAPMIAKVRELLRQGHKVSIFTARAGSPEQEQVVDRWVRVHVGKHLEITAVKSYKFTHFWDDRATRVVKNEGRIVPDEVYDRLAT